MLKLVVKSLDDDKAQDVIVIDLAGKSAMADYMVVCTGTSQRHIGSMTEHLREKLKAEGRRRVAVEGLTQGDWILVDGGDIIVHLFRPEVRAFYAIEKLWAPDESTAAAGTQPADVAAGPESVASEAMA